MNLAGRRAGSISLRTAVGTLHRDRRWWLLCLGYGFAATTGIGIPLAAGFVMESLDNSRRGYPSPLPPWSDPATRYLAGFFAILIDFTFFLLPLLIAGMLTLCTGIAIAIGAGNMAVFIYLLSSIGGAAGALVLVFFFCSIAPAGRLRFAREGRIEEAISGETWRWATSQHARGPFLRARIASLPAYLPALALAGVTLNLTRHNFPAQTVAIAAGFWLTMSALVYAHLVVVQLYVTAEKEVQHRELGM